MSAWDVCAVVGIVTMLALGFRLIHFVVETILIVTIGWTGIEELKRRWSEVQP